MARTVALIALLSLSQAGCPGTSSRPSDAAAEGIGFRDGGGDQRGDHPIVDGPRTEAAPPGSLLYAAPNGSGSTCSLAAPCSLTGARDRVRTMNGAMSGDLMVLLRGGTYVLTAPFELTTQDSGSNGFKVIYRAHPGEVPVLSGGAPLASPLALHDAAKNIWRATVGSINTRQIYVNGQRAVRARGPYDPPGFTETATGYTSSAVNLQPWMNVGHVEVVGFREWKSFRCGVASVSGTSVTMQQPCWTHAQAHQGAGFDYSLGLPSWIENALELLDEPGEWYLDRAGGYLYYRPRDGESAASASVIVPALEKLVDAHGTSTAPIHDLRLEGIAFAHATWLRPSTPDGYAALQAGVTTIGAGTQERIPAAVSLWWARLIRLERNLFQHLGAAALSLEEGSQDNEVVGNRFEDLSGGAIVIGDVTHAEDHHPTDPARIVKNNVIRSNHITRTGVEYHDTVGIWVGYAGSTSIRNNELLVLPYTGISVGWGWGSVDVGGSGGYTTPTPCAQNKIENNQVGLYLHTLRDGGGIYVLGAQQGSLMKGNYLADQSGDYAAYYLDNGTRHYTVEGNVACSAPHWLYVQGYATKATNNTVTGNYFDDASPQMTTPPPDPSNTVTGNTSVPGGSWPAAAQQIIDAAGLEPAYRDIGGEDAAARKATTASSEWSGAYSAGKGNDGRVGSGWSPTATDPKPWLQIDLGSPLLIRELLVVARQDLDQPETRRRFQLQASNSSSFDPHVVLGEQGPSSFPDRAIWSRRVDDGAAYRYVRAIKTAAEYFFIAELRVHANRSVGQGRPATSSSDYDAGHVASQGNDGDPASGWSPTSTDPGPWLRLDLASPHHMRALALITRQDLDQPVTRRSFAIQASNDPSFATFVQLAAQGTAPLEHRAIFSAYPTEPGAYRYVRAIKTAAEYFYVAELALFGERP